MRSPAVAIALVVLAVIFFLLALGYATGSFHPGTAGGHHYKHALLFAVLGVASLVGASFSRRQAAPATRY